MEERRLLSVTAVGAPTWVEQGPGPISNGNNVIIPGGTQDAAIQRFAVDPTNPARIFAATVDGGIWSTTNGTAASPNWTPLTDAYPSLSFGDVAFSPLDASENTLFAGTGRTSNGFTDGDPTTGVLKTTDSGAHWTQLGQSTLSGLTISSIVPTSIETTPGDTTTQVVLAATLSLVNNNQGLYRSTDAGKTWSLTGGGLPFGQGISELIGDPGNNMRFYAGIPGSGVFVSTDAGATWQADNGTGGNTIGGTLTSTNIVLSVHNDATVNAVYAAIVNASGQLGNVFRSTDQGANWTVIGTAPNTHPGSQGNNTALVADPTNANVVYVSGDRGTANNAGDVYEGNASTNTWTSLANGNANGTAPHPDSRYMAFDSNGDLLESNDGGLYKLVGPNSAGQNWVALDGNLRGTEFYSVAYDSVNYVIFGGAQDNGSPEQGSPGSFGWSDQTGGDGVNVAVDNTSDPGHSIHYTSFQSLGGFKRQTFDNTNTPSNANVQLRINGTTLTAQNAAGQFTFDNTIAFVTPYVLNAVDPTHMLIGTNFLYESTDQGDDLTALGGLTAGGLPANPIGAVNPGSTFFCTPFCTQAQVPMAYGGFDHGTPNEALIWTGGGGFLWLRTSGSGLPTKDTAFTTAGGATPADIVVDPDDWHTTYVLDSNGKVWKTTDAGTTWADMTGNLGSLTAGNVRTIELVKSGIHQVLLAGGQGGVYRAIDPASSPTWTKFGLGLPEVIVRDMHYNSADDVLLVGTDGRGALTIPNASTTLFTPSVLEINGDTDFPGENDTIRLVRDPFNPLELDVFVNNNTTTPDFQGDLASIQQINVNGLGGNDTLIIDDSNGLVSVSNGINYDGGTGFDSLQLVQTGPTLRTSDTYSVGLDNGSGTDVIADSTGTQTVFFQNLSPVTDTVPSMTFTVNASNANNAINLSQGAVAANGLITIDNFEPVQFSNKQALAINSLNGTDSVSINDSATPTGLAGVTINGGDPTAGDSLLVNGVGLTTTVNTSLHTIMGALGAGGAVQIGYSGIEGLTAVEGINKTLALSGSSTYAYTAGSALDAGSVQTDSIPITFTGLTTALSLAGGGGGSVVVNGTTGQDTFSAAAGGDVTISGRATIHTSGISGLTLNGLGGNDMFNVAASQPYGSIAIAGGAGGTATLTGNGPALSATLGPTTAVTGGGLGNVSVSGISTLNLSAGAGAINLTGGAGADAFIVTVTGTNTAAIQDAPFALLVNTSNTGGLSIDGGPQSVSDSFALKTLGAATVGYQPSSATGGIVTANGTVVALSNVESFTYNGQGGASQLNVTGSAVSNAFTLTPGATNDSGTVAMDATLPLSFQNLGAGGVIVSDGVGGAGSLTYNGTAANDSFNVDALGVIRLGLHVPVTTTGIATLTLNGLDGDDTFTLVPAISSSVYPMMFFNGGSAATPTGNVTNLTGTGASDSFAVSGQTVQLGGTKVVSSGMQNIFLSDTGTSNSITYNGVAGTAENINLIGSTTANAGQISIPGTLLLTFSGVQRLLANGNSADGDTLTFTGTNASDIFQINMDAPTVMNGFSNVLQLQTSGGANLLALVNYTGFNTLNVAGLDGADTFNVYTGPDVARQIAINGSIPNAKKKLTDLLNVYYVFPKPHIVQSTQTQNHNSGLVSLQYSPTVTDLIQYTQVENVVIKKL